MPKYYIFVPEPLLQLMDEGYNLFEEIAKAAITNGGDLCHLNSVRSALGVDLSESSFVDATCGCSGVVCRQCIMSADVAMTAAMTEIGKTQYNPDDFNYVVVEDRQGEKRDELCALIRTGDDLDLHKIYNARLVEMAREVIQHIKYNGVINESA